MRKLLCASLMLLVLVSLVFGQTKFDWNDTASACKLMSIVEGFQTKGWREYVADEWGCATPYIKIEKTPQILGNNIAYYVVGSKASVRELKLVLNVNNKEESREAHQILMLSSKVLFKLALGSTLPAEIETAITNGETKQWNLSEAKVSLVKDVWPTGKGYGVKLSITPAAKSLAASLNSALTDSATEEIRAAIKRVRELSTAASGLSFIEYRTRVADLQAKVEEATRTLPDGAAKQHLSKAVADHLFAVLMWELGLKGGGLKAADYQKVTEAWEHAKQEANAAEKEFK